MSKKGLKLFMAVTAALLVIFVFNGGADELTNKVDKIFSKWDSTVSPGVALAIIKDGKIIYKRGYGMANLDHNIPITPKTVFRIGSTSKQFAAFCIALLEEQGKISFDDDIRKYLPEMPEYNYPITIRHIIHHTSGLRDSDQLMALAGRHFGDFITQEDMLKILARQKEINFNPGDEFLYSNAGYVLMVDIVKRVSGKSLRDFAEENIFKPLNMTNTLFKDDHTMIIKNRATGYSPGENGDYRVHISMGDYVGDGGLFTTVEELYHWDQNFYNNKLGKGGQELIEQVLTPGVLNNGNKLNYAFGLIVTKYNGLKLIRHAGGFVGFRAEMIRLPEHKFSVICLANMSTISPQKLCNKVVDIYLAKYFKEEKKAPKLAAKTKPIESAPTVVPYKLTRTSPIENPSMPPKPPRDQRTRAGYFSGGVCPMVIPKVKRNTTVNRPKTKIRTSAMIINTKHSSR